MPAGPKKSHISIFLASLRQKSVDPQAERARTLV
jgi:hypothetical protein